MRVRFLLVTACLCVAVMAPSVALAATSETATSSAEIPAPVGAMEVQVWPGGDVNKLVAIISLRLPQEVGLPATARIPIPEGMTTDWTGEIAGGGAAEDVPRNYRVVKGANGDYVEFTVTTSLLAQAEFSSSALKTDDKRVSAQFSFVQSVPATFTSFSVRLPANTKLLSLEPKPEGLPDRNDVGETLYSLPDNNLKTGEKATVSVSYEDVGVTPLPKSGPEPITIALWVLGGLLATAILALAFLAGRRRAVE